MIIVQVASMALGGHRTVANNLEYGFKHIGCTTETLDLSAVDGKSVRTIGQYRIGRLQLVRRVMAEYRMARYLRRKNVKFSLICHSHTAVLLIGLCKLKLNSQMEIISVFHTLDKSWISNLLVSLHLFWADRIVLVSHFAEHFLPPSLPKKLSSKIRIIYNPLDSLSIERATNNEVHRSARGAERSIDINLNLFMAARFTKQKKILELIDLVTAYNKNYPQHLITLTIFGDGPLRPSIEDRLRAVCTETNRIILAGALPHHDLLLAMPKFDACIHLSRWEADPMILTEALAMGIPVVTNKFHGLESHRLLTSIVYKVSESEEGFVRAIRKFILDYDAIKDRTNKNIVNLTEARNPIRVARRYLNG